MARRFRNPRELKALFANLKNKLQGGGRRAMSKMKKPRPDRQPISEYDDVSTPVRDNRGARRPMRNDSRPMRDEMPRRPNAVARPMRDSEEEAQGIFRTSDDYYESKNGPKRTMFEAPKEEVDEHGKPKKNTREILREMINEARKKLNKSKSMLNSKTARAGAAGAAVGGAVGYGARRSQHRDEFRY